MVAAVGKGIHSGRRGPMVGNAAGFPLARRVPAHSTRGSRAAYQPTRATARSLRSAALHSAPCSVATGRAGYGALEPRGRVGTAQRGGGMPRRQAARGEPLGYGTQISCNGPAPTTPRINSSSLSWIATEVAVLGVLDEEHHQEGDDGRSGIYRQLPAIREVEQSARLQPTSESRGRRARKPPASQ